MLNEKFFTIREAATALNVSRSLLYVLINQGAIVTTQLGARTVRIAEHDLRAFIATRTRRNAPPATPSNYIEAV